MALLKTGTELQNSTTGFYDQLNFLIVINDQQFGSALNPGYASTPARR
jgi:hypothetical protein